ncbi:hypothetical protein SEPCBS57363_001737 [Sporothrix epigloea]|uniref:Transmembrane protein n=1 Tax=Sporothrix epigloea TaxID=1892477 RepID=A0ABP0DDM1_9PEZI
MACQFAVQNFSLPSRTGSLRLFSSTVVDDRDIHDGDSDPGTTTSFNSNRTPRRVPKPTLTPASSAIHLFHFNDETAAQTAARPRMLLRPMSTSSLAPALTALGDNINNHAREGSVENDIVNQQKEAFKAKCLVPPAIAVGMQRADVRMTTESVGTNLGENHFATSVLPEWARQMSAPARSPTKKTWQSASEQIQDGDSLDGRVQANGIANTRIHAGDANSVNSLDNELPGLARSVSIRRGPRLRHISLSEVQAADDAARRISNVRRERRVFWALVALALIGVLSCPGAVTLAVAQAAMQAGVEEIGPDENGGGPIWDSRTLGWLVASLLVSVSATAGLAVATSARCRRRRDAVGREDTYSLAGEKAVLAQLVQSGTRGGRQAAAESGLACGDGSRCSHRFSALFSNRARQHQVAASQTRETRETRQTGDSRAGWVEMDDADDEPVNGTGVFCWWPLKPSTKEVSTTANLAGAENTDRIASTNEISDKVSHRFSNRSKYWKKDTGLKEKNLPLPSTAPVCEEDRNWNKFTQDPIQLRRYVETLEFRLATVERVHQVLNTNEPEINVAAARHLLPDFVRSPGMALPPRAVVRVPNAGKTQAVDSLGREKKTEHDV